MAEEIRWKTVADVTRSIEGRLPMMTLGCAYMSTMMSMTLPDESKRVAVCEVVLHYVAKTQHFCWSSRPACSG